MTKLAISSVEEYTKIQSAYDKVGCLEIATSEEEVKAEIISAAAAAALALQYVRAEMARAALHFPDDDTARAGIITTTYCDQAIAKGSILLEATIEAVKVDQNDGPKIAGLSTNLGSLPCSRVIFATGIWTSRVLSPLVSLAIIPVAHPYIHGCPRAPLPGRRSPFIRYPDSRIYR